MKNPILRIALPSIVSNITVPLLGLVDAAIAGHLGSPVCLGAIAVGGMIFNMLYWLFSFLRMGTGGLTAQAFGASRPDEAFRVLLRSLGVAVSFGLLFILCQMPILHLVFHFLSATPEVKASARIYYSILIWGAPAVMSLYSFVGWFLGMQNARFPMYISIVQNVLNIAVSLILVVSLKMRIEGVAIGTLVAQYGGLVLAIFLWRKHYARLFVRQALKDLWQRAPIARFFAVNRDIFLRTLCLVAVTTSFTSFGAAMGDLTLAGNALLMQFFILFSYVMDGFAYAGEALGGRYVGATSRQPFVRLTRHLFCWGVSLAVAFTLLYAVGGGWILEILTNETDVVSAARPLLPLVCCVPLVSMPAFVFDGLYIGATATRQMLLSMAAATGVFFAMQAVLPPGNPMLWVSFLCYLGTRGLVQAFLYHVVVRRAFVRVRSVPGA